MKLKRGLLFLIKDNIKVIQFLPLLFIFSDACVDPLAVELPKISPRLVVDGLITNEPGPYTVNLFYTTTIDSTLKRPKDVIGATLFILDDAGHSEPLYETTPGHYQTNPASTFRGEVGRSYALQIITQNDKQYSTKLQEMMPAGTIDKLELEFENDAIDSAEPSGPSKFDALNLFVDAHGETTDPNLFRWRWAGTYKFKTYPELQTEGGINGPIPNPEPCSGYVVGGPAGIRQVGPCTCCICWATDYSPNAVVSANQFVSDNVFKKVPIGAIAITSFHFYEKYHLEVEQLSVSSQVYEFWRLVKIQQETAGNISQPNAIKIRGNVSCVTNPDEEVLGVFSVSAVVRKSIFIYPEQIPAPLPPLRVYPADCRTLQNSSTTQPSFW